jgi:subtilisin family serine protease
LRRSAGDDIVAFPYIPYLSLFVDPVQLDRLLDDPDVVSIEEDVLLRPGDAQSNALIHAPDVWAKGDSGQGYSIAILDSGVAACAPGPIACPVVQHPALQGQVIAEACFSTTSIAEGWVSLCPGSAASSTAPDSGVNCPYPQFYGGCEHGTEIASIAVADGGLLEVEGAAPGATIISIQVFSEGSTQSACAEVYGPGAPNPCILSSSTDMYSALMWVYDKHLVYKIAAVNLSQQGATLYDGTCDTGYGDELTMEATAVDLLRGAGIAVVSIAGNGGADGEITGPGCLSGTTAVANSEEDSTTYLEDVNPNSNYSSLVKLVAPGTHIFEAIPGGNGNDYTYGTGTSEAAPHVAGAFALLKAAKPSASVSDIEAALACTGKPLERNRLYKPRIDLLGAYDYLLQPGAATRSWNFQDPQQAFDWRPLASSTWLPMNGQYVVSLPKAVPTGVATMTADPNNAIPGSQCLGSSFTVEATMTRVYPDETNSNAVFPGSGIYFKYSPFAGTGYWFNYTYETNIIENPYSPLLPGVLGVVRLDGPGPGTQLCLEQATTDNKFTVNKNAPNTLTVISDDDTFQFYINGTQVCKGMKPDATYVTGAVAVGTTFLQTAGNSFSVSKVSVQSPVPTALATALREARDDTIDPARPFPAVHTRPGIAVETVPFGAVYVTH